MNTTDPRPAGREPSGALPGFDPVALADWLVAQHCTRARFSPLPAILRPESAEDAYAAQDAFVHAKARDCGEPIGWKIALSNPVMQRFVGLAEPVSGRLLRRQVVGGPARARASEYGRLMLEFEIAVELGADLPDPGPDGYTKEAAGVAVAAVRPAMEIIDDRNIDYDTGLSTEAMQLIADNALNEGAALGARRTDWRSLDLAALRGVVSVDGRAVGEGTGRDLMGHPLQALAWLATHACRRGRMLRAGECVILGSLVTTQRALPGQHWRLALDGFEPLEIAID